MKKGRHALLVLLALFTLNCFSQTPCVYQEADIYDGAFAGNPNQMIEYDGKVYFSAADATNGTELFVYDGVDVTLAADIRPGFFSSQPNNFIVYAGDLYFSANDGTNGTELYKFDGTTASLVADIYSGAFHSYPKEFVVVGSDLYFTADDGINGTELWKYDGVTASMVADIYPGAIPSNPENLVALGSNVCFFANDGVAGIELWEYDGATANLVSDVFPGATTSNPDEMVEMDGSVYWRANDGVNGTELWKYDGTSASMIEINPGGANGNPAGMTVIGSELYFRGFEVVNGYELWIYDGTSLNFVEDLNPGPHPNNSFPDNFTEYDGDIYFQADNGTTGFELYKYDGSSISLVEDINVGGDDSNPADFTVMGANLYLTADDGVIGEEIYKFDGTTLSLGDDIYPGATSSAPDYVTPYMGSEILMAADDGIDGIEFWIWPVDADMTSAITVENCGDYTAPSGTVYSGEGIYLFDDTIPSVLYPQCDSIITIDLTIVSNDPSFSYPTDTYCMNEDNPEPDAIGSPGGTFSASPSGMFIYPSTGEIDMGFSLPGTYTVKHVTSEACSPTDSSTTTITLVAEGNALFNYDASSYCVGEGTTEPIILAEPGGTFSSTPAGLDINPSTGMVDLSSSSVGAYTIKYVTGGMCPDSMTLPFSVESINTDVTADGNYLSAEESGASYQWIKCEPDFYPVIGANGKNWSAPTNGTYCVEVTIGECKDTSDCVSVLYFDIDEPILSGSVAVYPNPVVNNLNVQHFTDGELNVQLTDNSGKIMQTVTLFDDELQLDMSQYAPGMYFLMLSNQYGTHLEKIIKK